MIARRLLDRRNGALRAMLALGALLCLGSCDSKGSEAELTADEYVEVYVELLQAADAAPDSMAAADSARRILAARGLREEDLLDFARRHTDDPRVLANVWRRIEERLRAPEPTDTAGADTLSSDSTAARRERR